MPKNPVKRKRYGSHYYVDKRSGNGYARVQIPTGERNAQGKLIYKTITKSALNQTDADEIVGQILEDYKKQGTGYLEGRELTFADLAEWYCNTKLIEPVYSDGKLIAGERGWKIERSRVGRMVKLLGKIKLAELKEDALLRYRNDRIKIGGVKPATVNREIARIRIMLRRAYKRKLIRELPEFEEILIKNADRPREVVLNSRDEEALLKEARKLKSRLYYLIIALHETGARPSEMYPYTSGKLGVNFEPPTWKTYFADGRKTLALVGFKGRDREARIVPITDKLRGALDELWAKINLEKEVSLDELIFPATTYDNAWRKLKTKVTLEAPDLRLRDLRRSFKTKLVKAGYPELLAMKLLGHKTPQIAYDYLAIDRESILQAGNLLNENKVEIQSNLIN